MGKILLAWELGANFGHLTRLLPVARRLRELGHDLLFAVRDTATAESVLTPHRFRYVQAPVFHGQVRLPQPPRNYAELLLAEGYGDASRLTGRVRAWMGIMETFAADLVMADHAPTASLAARALGRSIVLIGNAFEMPPEREPLPSIRPWEAVADAALAAADGRACERINAALQQCGGRPLAQITELFTGIPRILASFAELDHYGAREAAEYVGPLFGPASQREEHWLGTAPKVLAYLRNGTPGLRNLLDVLKASQAEVLVALPGISDRQSRELSTERCRILPGFNLPALLPQANVVVCHGGTATLSQSLLAGVPLLLAPGTVEQYLGARQAAKTGAAITLTAQRSKETIAAALDGLLQQDRYRRSAAAFAHKYADFSIDGVVAKTVRLVECTLSAATAQLH